MPERLNGLHSKCSIPETVSEVRILPLPHNAHKGSATILLGIAMRCRRIRTGKGSGKREFPRGGCTETAGFRSAANLPAADERAVRLPPAINSLQSGPVRLTPFGVPGSLAGEELPAREGVGPRGTGQPLLQMSRPPPTLYQTTLVRSSYSLTSGPVRIAPYGAPGILAGDESTSVDPLFKNISLVYSLQWARS